MTPPKASTSGLPGKLKSVQLPSAGATKPPVKKGLATSSGTGQDGAKLSKLEKALFERLLKASTKGLRQHEVEATSPDLEAQDIVDTINSLIGRGMVEARSDGKELSYRTIDKNRQKLSSGMLPDEKLVFDHISNAGNTGIWTKTLKARTNIHQTNITKYLKSLEGKNLIKSVKSVKHPTRKIYMLSELQPSIELSGGPWYTDNELDTEFIGYLLKGIRKCLQEKSFPSEMGWATALYPTVHTAYLHTTVEDVLDYLSHLGIIQPGTELSTEHIKSLLDVLIYDGEVERLTVGPIRGRQGLGVAPGQGADEAMSFGASDDDLNVHEGRKNDGNSVTSRTKRRTATAPPKSNKKPRLSSPARANSMDSDNIDEDSLDQDASMQEHGAEETKALALAGEGQTARPLRSAFKPLRNHTSGHAVVYRYVRPLPNDPAANRTTGIYDVPCGRCPQFAFCAEKGRSWQSRGRGEPLLARVGLVGIGGGFSAVGGLGAQGGVAPVNPADCMYFNEWLEF